MVFQDAHTEGGTVVFSSGDRDLVETCSLVLSAQDIEHLISGEAGGTMRITVPSELAEPAIYQLDSFFQENENWPPAPPPRSVEGKPPTPPTVLLIGALALFYAVTGPWNSASIWFQNGAGDADAIVRNGQWYRLVTALTLHADFSHLLGNCLIGGFLLHFFLQIYGSGLGIAALMLSATLGNLINVEVHGGSHLFVGFSTAVFASIGMLSAHQIVEQRSPFGIRMLAPFLAGAALLAMLGSSGARTDLGAHLFGLAAGMAIGFGLEHPMLRRLRRIALLQTILFSATLFFVVFAWSVALSSST